MTGAPDFVDYNALIQSNLAAEHGEYDNYINWYDHLTTGERATLELQGVSERTLKQMWNTEGQPAVDAALAEARRRWDAKKKTGGGWTNSGNYNAHPTLDLISEDFKSKPYVSASSAGKDMDMMEDFGKPVEWNEDLTPKLQELIPDVNVWLTRQLYKEFRIPTSTYVLHALFYYLSYMHETLRTTNIIDRNLHTMTGTPHILKHLTYRLKHRFRRTANR